MNIQENIHTIREDFPLLKKCCYLNAASHAPPFLPMRTAIQDFLEDKFRYDELHWEKWLEDVEVVKDKFSALVNGGGRENVNFGFNVSQNFNNILSSIRFKKGDEIIFGDAEFPALLFPLKRMEANHGVRLVKIGDTGLVKLDEIEEKTTERTKAIALSHVSFSSGARLDIEAVGRFAREHDIIFMVDAAQSLCAVDVDVRKAGIDYFTATGAKWQLGFYGVCPFYLSPQLHGKLGFPVSGWMSKKDMMDFDYVFKADTMDYRQIMRQTAADLNTGTPALIDIFAFRPCIELFLKLGMKQVEKRITSFSGILLDELGDSILFADELRERRAGVVVYKFKSKAEEDEVRKRFEKEKIQVSFRFGGIRIAPHFYNTEDEVHKLIRILTTVGKKYK